MADTKKASEVFSAEEKAAMKERAKELKASGKKEDELKDVLEKIAALSDSDRAIAERIHALIAEHVPALSPKSWYGMPAYARDGTIIVFVQPADKFKTRYSTLGFSDAAKLDEGSFWANAFAITTLEPADEATIIKLITKAAG